MGWVFLRVVCLESCLRWGFLWVVFYLFSCEMEVVFPVRVVYEIKLLTAVHSAL